MTVSRRLRTARLRAGLSLRALADRAGLNWTTLWKLEQGLVTPRLDTLQRIARALRVPLTVLVADAPRRRRTEDAMTRQAEVEDRIAELEEEIQDLEDELEDLESEADEDDLDPEDEDDAEDE